MNMDDKDYIRFSIIGLQFELHKKRYFFILLKVWVIMLMILILSSVFGGYQMTNADIPGGAISGVFISYFIHMHIED
jgi:hypothetical protein